MAKESNDFDEGNVSKWNEGNLKSLRLHEAQEIINTSKLNPLKRVNGVFNYDNWIYGINILYGEGHSKYGIKERESIEKIKDVINMALIINSPVVISVMSGMGTSKNKIGMDYEKWENLRKLIEMFEQKVKYFNDIHGLSTRNLDSEHQNMI